MNKRFTAALAALAVVMIQGCASEDVRPEGKAGVEERGTTTAPPAPPKPPGPIVIEPIRPSDVQGNPLKDPKNILSKRSIFYDYDKDDIKEEYRPMVQAHARYLAQNRGMKMLVQGNADERGSREYNIALGQRRADAVKRMLVLLGASESQVEAVSLGEEKPRCTAQTEECYAQNRRSDMLYSGEY
jgi:peptidoglycan-associated lipoprotein